MTAQDVKNSILQLAIQGKLVEQRAEDGSAKELLEQIKAEKEQLIKDRKIKKEKPLPEISEDEIPFDTPVNWEWVRLGEVVSVYGGKRIPAGRNLVDIDTGHKYIRVADMKNGSINLDGIKYVPDDIYEKIKAYSISANDIYITVAGTIGQVGTVPMELDNANLTENADKLIVYNFNKEYMLYMLNSLMVQYQIKNATTKVGQPKLAIVRIQSLIVPIPPLEEQKRIVAKIEELMPYVDKYDKAYSKLEVFNKKFPADMQKSILQYAIQGKLVEQRPDEGSAEELYQQIQEEKARLIMEGKIKKEKPLIEIKEDEIPFEIPESWKWVRLKEVSKNIHYGFTASACDIGNSKMVRITDIQNNRVDWNNVPFCDVTEIEYEKYGLNNRDIMIARTGGTIGKSYIVDELSDRAVFASYLIRIIPVDIINEKYLKLFMETPLYWKQLISYSMGTGQPNVNGVSLSMLVLPLPPLEEQKRIVEVSEEYLPYCQQLIK